MNLLGIGPMELIVIFVVGFLVLGPRRLADVAKTLGKTVSQIKKATEDLPSLLEEGEDKPSSSTKRDHQGKNGDA